MLAELPARQAVQNHASRLPSLTSPCCLLLRPRTLQNLMAAYGLLGAALELQSQPGGERLVPAPAGEPSPWLFIAHQKRLSLQQMGIYSEFVAEYEEMSEDFEGDFS